MTQQILAEFADGTTAPVEFVTRCPEFSVALARRSDGYQRCLFIDHDLRLHPDDWIVAVRPVAPPQACRAYPIPILAKEKVL